MKASFSSVLPPPVSQSRQNLVDAANPRHMPVTAAEKKASTKLEWNVAPVDRTQSITQYLASESAPRPANVSRHDPVAILDRTLELWV